MLLSEAPSLVTQDTLYMIGAVAVGTASIMAYLQRMQSSNKKFVYETRRLIFRVMSLHNQEDDDRFAELKNDLWKLRVRNAMKDGEVFPEPEDFPRRRYLENTLTEDGDEIHPTKAA
jgi:hypothetical protein